MRAISLDLENYRSFQHANLSDLLKTNVFIGRNNSGKSSLIGGLGAVAFACTGSVLTRPNPTWPDSAPFKDSSLTTRLKMVFELEEFERSEFIDRVFSTHSSGWRLTREELLASPFARQLSVRCEAGAGQLEAMLSKVHLMGEDGEDLWILLQDGNQITDFVSQVRECLERGNQINYMSVRNERGERVVGYLPRDLPYHGHADGSSGLLGLELIRRYFRAAFFFGTHRRGLETMEVGETNVLLPDGGNLPGVLSTLALNNYDQFAEIKDLLHIAVPDVGVLRAKLAGKNTQVVVREASHEIDLRLAELGSGVEQLLMILTAVVSSPQEPVLIIEEPETNLHPAAQRFVQDIIRDRAYQSFITTHSSIFLGDDENRAVYRVESREGFGRLTSATASQELREALESIGACNSDLLLSDRVLFVEGATDKVLLEAIAQKLDASLAAAGVTLLDTGGAAFAGRHFPLRSEVIEKISANSLGIPHWFLMDRDERSSGELERLTNKLGDKLLLLDRREIENYLLEPGIIRAAVRLKYAQNDLVCEKLGGTGDEEIRAWIDDATFDLKNIVLCKRIAAEIGGLPKGLLPRDRVSEMARESPPVDLIAGFRALIAETWEKDVDSKPIEFIVQQQSDEIGQVWEDPEARKALAPGDEVLSAVFSKFSVDDQNVRFKKSRDMEYFAQVIEPAQIHSDLRKIIEIVTS